MKTLKTFQCFTQIVVMFIFYGNWAVAQTPVRDDRGYHLMDYDGEILTEVNYDFIGKESNDLFVAVKNGFWGYLNSDGQLEIPLEYDVSYPYDGSFALVGKNGNFFHINKSNEIFEKLTEPIRPSVYKRKLLLAKENKNKVLYEDGTVLLESNHPLILASKSGIIEWNIDNDSVYQHISPYGNKTLRKTFKYGEVDSLMVTQQGYLCLQKEVNSIKTYFVYDERGELLAEIPAEGNHPSYIRVVWNEFVYWPGEGQVFYPEVLFGQEVHYPMNSLSRRGKKNRTNFPFQLSDKYYSDKMVLLPNTEKWIQFDGLNVEGSRIFDEIVTGDKISSLVRIDRNWYILNRREDTLIRTQFKSIHPAGMNNMRFFASTQRIGVHEEKWAFVNLKKRIITDEVFAIPSIKPQELSLFEEPKTYEWGERLNMVIKDGNQVFIDNDAIIIWTNPSGKEMTEQDFFGIDFKFKSRNFKRLSKKNDYKRNRLNLKIKQNNVGLEVFLSNTSNKPIPIEVQDGHFRAILEFQNKKGEWETIASLAPSWCGNSYYMIEFPTKKVAITKVNLPKGSTRMLIRATVLVDSETKLISNELEIMTNHGRIWISKY